MYPDCVCGNNNYTTRSYDNGKKFDIIICQNCGLGQTWPRPVALDNADDFYNNQEDFFERNEEIILRKKFAHNTLSILKKIREGGKLLDVGCNMGIFVHEALRKGYDAHGIDIAINAINFGIKKLQLKNNLSAGTIKDIINKNEKYDIISYIHVMEHIEKINEEIKYAKKILKINGLLVLETPNYNSIWRLIVRGKWYGFSPEQHVWQFSREALTEMLIKEKFNIVYASTRHSIYHKITFDLRGAVKIILYFISYLLNKGDNLIIIAEKNED